MSKIRLFVKDILWAIELAKRALEKRLLLPRISVPSKTPDRYDEISVEKDVAIPMRDGVRLYADVYRPRATGRFPVILIRLPYGKGEHYCYMPPIGRFWAKKGYVCVAQDVRGKWRSEGQWDPFVNEANDGYDTLDWIAGQPWCDGNVGMMGESYYGYTTWAAATTGHSSLKCIAPSTTAMDIYGVWVYNGALCMQTMATWAIEMNARKYANPLRLDHWNLPLISMADKAGIPCHTYKDWLRHPTRDAYWEPINLYQEYAQIKIPVLHFGGWYDVFLKATIEDWIGVRGNAKDADVRENQWLVIGPWDHEYTTDSTHRIGRLKIGDTSATMYWDGCQAFFDFWLKGIDNGFDETPRVKVFTMGDNEFRSGSEWPPAETIYRDFYFHSGGNAHLADGDGSLGLTPPTSAQPADRYVYDPLDPVALATGVELWARAESLQDRARLPERPDVLVYDTAPLEADLEITGPISVILYAASSARDTDFTAALVDVFPDGYAHLVQEGIVRARYRESDREPTLIEPGWIYQYVIDLWATSYVVRKSHQIRVEISSSNFDRWDRNPNTGHEIGMDAEVIKVEQTIYHETEHPSRITLPIVPR